MSGARLVLAIAVGAIAIMAVIYFITSWFVLEDENPRQGSVLELPTTNLVAQA
ncbi:MAG: hypothetical protein K0R27_3456 [Xanthobacteraceae bacterium]|jgi:uncharacterized protein YggT (Ycf19 family)|nr:hypothetical protein [Xanthobacteraceae bacterium]